MVKLVSVISFSRYVWVILLWAALLNTGEALAGKISAPHKRLCTLQSQLALSETTLSEAPEQQTSLGTKKKKITAEARVTPVHIVLPQTTTEPAQPPFFIPTSEAIPPYAARAPGGGILARISPLIIQTNAP